MYFGKPKLKIINLERFSVESAVKKGIAKEHNGIYEMNLNNYKIIGELPLPLKLKIHAGAASDTAMESVKKHGGEIILPAEKEEKKVDIKASK